jgi:hypothetical protein
MWTGAKNLVPTGIWRPDRPARSESLYRLNRLGFRVNTCLYIICINMKIVIRSHMCGTLFHNQRYEKNKLILALRQFQADLSDGNLQGHARKPELCLWKRTVVGWKEEWVRSTCARTYPHMLRTSRHSGAPTPPHSTWLAHPLKYPEKYIRHYTTIPNPCYSISLNCTYYQHHIKQNFC